MKWTIKYKGICVVLDPIIILWIEMTKTDEADLKMHDSQLRQIDDFVITWQQAFTWDSQNETLVSCMKTISDYTRRRKLFFSNFCHLVCDKWRKRIDFLAQTNGNHGNTWYAQTKQQKLHIATNKYFCFEMAALWCRIKYRLFARCHFYVFLLVNVSTTYHTFRVCR